MNRTEKKALAQAKTQSYGLELLLAGTAIFLVMLGVVFSLFSTEKLLSPTNVSKRDPVGGVESFEEPAFVRRAGETSWQAVKARGSLFPGDSVRTGTKGSARVWLQNGSYLNLGEEALATVEPSEPSFPLIDRFVIHNGSFLAETPKELWLMGSGALAKILASSGSRGLADLSIKNRTLNVALKQGAGSLLALKNQSVGGRSGLDSLRTPETEIEGMQALSFEKGGAIELNPAKELLGSSPADWPSKKSVLALEMLGRGRAPTFKALEIESPTNGLHTRASFIQFSGRALGSEMQINGDLVPLKDARFSKKLSLNAGTNTFVFQLKLPDGSSVNEQRTVVRLQASPH